MRHMEKLDGLKQNSLFDIESFGWWHTQLDPGVLRRLDDGIEGMIRRTVLRLMPAVELGQAFCEDFGRPTKELYAICALMLLAEFKNWTIDDTADAWCLNSAVQYALNLPRDRQSLCPRTVDNYRRLLRENDRAQEIFETVTAELVSELGISIKKQRLDSTHVLSNMARFGRLKFLAITVRRFLVQLKRHARAEYDALPEALKKRYLAAESRLFGSGTKQTQNYAEALQQTGEDIGELIARFSGDEAIAKRPSYQKLERAFREHCELTDAGEIAIRPKAEDENGKSSQVMQNTSDPDAGYSGHKGAGHQVQLAQTHGHKEEGPGIIVGCIVENAGEADAQAPEKIAAQQKRMGTLPEELLADTAYGSQANIQASAARGCELISPAAGKKKADIGENGGDALDQRRAKEETAEWKENYAKRSGIEGLNAALKNTTGMRRLRVRGAKAVAMSIYFKVTGWNIRSAVQIARRRTKNAKKAAQATRPGVLKSAKAATPRTDYRPQRKNPLIRGNKSRERNFSDFEQKPDPDQNPFLRLYLDNDYD